MSTGDSHRTLDLSVAVAALHRWSHDRADLRHGTKQAKRNGYTPRQSRQADARQVRVILPMARVHLPKFRKRKSPKAEHP